jgi:integrase/recombinase XerD
MFKDLIDTFINYLRVTNKSNETLIGYRKELTYFLNFAQANLNCRIYIEDITIDLLEEYLVYLKDIKKCQPATVNRAVHVLRSFYNYLVKRELYNRNIAAMLEPVKLQQKERGYLKESEFKGLIDQISNKLVYVIITTLYYTGLRISECLNLTINNVDMQNKLIHVIAGKGNKDRSIPINEKLHIKLTEYLKDIRPISNSLNFFASETSGKVSREYINKALKKATIKSGITLNVTCHILRHSFATNLVTKNVNIVHIQKLLGHSSLNVTSIYTHTSLPELQKSVNML